MEVKKSPKANLENKKLLFREIGLIVTLLVVLLAFEYKSYDNAALVLQEQAAVEVEVENIPITTEAPPPPPEAPEIPVISDQLEIVDDDIAIDEDLFISLEDHSDMGVEVMDYVSEIYDENIEEAIPYAFVEQKPTFMGGDATTAFSLWVGGKMDYPEIAKENGIQGRVILQFTVDTKGNVINVRVIRGIDSSLDKEAVRIVSMSPKWTPGRQRDRAVSVTYNFPVIFQLR